MHGINNAASIRFLSPPLANFKPVFDLLKPGGWFLPAKCVKNTCLRMSF